MKKSKVQSCIKKLEENRKIMDEYYQETKILEEKIKNYFRTADDDEIRIDDGKEKILYAKYVKVNSINYDYEKLKKVVDKEVMNKIIDKDIVVDSSELRRVLKEHPNIKKLLKKSLIVNKKVNDEKIEEAYKQGKITLKAIKAGSIVSSYERLTISRKNK